MMEGHTLRGTYNGHFIVAAEIRSHAPRNEMERGFGFARPVTDKKCRTVCANSLPAKVGLA